MKTSDNKSAAKIHYWWGKDLMERLDYKHKKSFIHLIEEATKVMIDLEIPYYDNIILSHDDEGNKDFKLSRFACYIIVMLADYKKEKVAEAKSRFLRAANKYGLEYKDFLEIGRIEMREELSDANKWLSSMAIKAGVDDFSTFVDAGYKGLYAMESSLLKSRRNIESPHSHNDHMGPIELLANLMRIALTEQRIWNEGISGQNNLERVHFEVGKSIRELLNDHIGNFPENLPIFRNLKLLKKGIKSGYKKMISTNDTL